MKTDYDECEVRNKRIIDFVVIYLVWFRVKLLLIRGQLLLFGTPRFRHVTRRCKGNPCVRIHSLWQVSARPTEEIKVNTP